MFLSELSPARGAKKKKKRIGRGPGSGHGKTACRGHKGQKSRSGFSLQPGFEGGQMPLHRRLPKRGFTNIFRVENQVVNVGRLSIFEADAVVDRKALQEKGLVRRPSGPVKILGKGELSVALTVEADAFSEGAKKAIEEAGGTVKIIQSEEPQQ